MAETSRTIPEIVPFAKDPKLRDLVLQQMAAHGIRIFVETGTNRGWTSGWMASQGFEVYTCETNAERFERARAVYGHLPTWHAYHESSRQRVPLLVDSIFEPALWYLDAHWEGEWPILDELRAIGRCESGVIVIHDFKVPGKSTGFDSYGGQALDWDYISPVLEKHFGKVDHFYHEKPEGPHNRGAIFLRFANNRRN